jgi:hypothetical protein
MIDGTICEISNDEIFEAFIDVVNNRDTLVLRIAHPLSNVVLFLVHSQIRMSFFDVNFQYEIDVVNRVYLSILKILHLALLPFLL